MSGVALAMPTNDEHKRRRARNIALGLVLGLLAVLFFVVSIVKMGAGG